MMSRDQKFGLHWEMWALDQLKARGYHEARLVSNWFASLDILLGMLPIEIKAATPRKHFNGHCWRQRWQFDVSRLPKLVDSLVILIAVDRGQGYPFIVPSWLIGFRSNVHITSHPERYQGYFKQFLNEWGYVDLAKGINAQYAGQMFLPLGTGDTLHQTQGWGQKSSLSGIEKPLSPSPFLQGDTL